MSGIPPLPPLRIKESDGSPNVIPVNVITLSNITLTNQGGGKVLLDGAGGTGPQGPAGTLTIGSGITGGATDGFLLMVSNGATLGQVTSSAFQRAIAFPVTTGSGGTGRTTIGSAHTILGVNSSEASLSYYSILGGNNATVSVTGTSIFVNALTSDISGKQDSLSIPLIVTSGGTGLSVSGSATALIGMNSSGVVYDYYQLVASDNITIVRSGTNYIISAAGGSGGTTSTAGLVQSSLTISTTFPLSGGGNLSTNRTFFVVTGGAGQVLITSAGATGDLAWVNTLGGASGAVYAATDNSYVVMNLASDLVNEYRLVQSGNSITVTTASGLITINATTGDLSVKQDLITFPLSIASGGTARTTAGSAHTLLGVNSDGATLSYYAILASDNTTIVKNGTGIFISANTGTGTGGGGASTANSYVVTDFTSDLSNEFRLVQSGNSITINTAGNLIVINAVTGNLSTKQDSITIPLIVGSGGTGQTSLSPYAILYGSGANAIQSLPTMNSGQVIVGSGTNMRPHVFGPGSDGQYMVAKSGVLGGFVFVDTLGAGGGPVYAPTGGFYITWSSDTLLSSEKILTSSNSTVNISTDGSAIYLESQDREIRSYYQGFSGNLHSSFNSIYSTSQETNVTPGAASIQTSAGWAYFMPFVPSENFTCDIVYVEVASAGVNSVLKFSVYGNSANNVLIPFNLLATSPIITGNTTGVKSSNLVFTVSKNSLYWISVINGTAANCALRSQAAGNVYPIFGLTEASLNQVPRTMVMSKQAFNISYPSVLFANSAIVSSQNIIICMRRSI